MEFKYHKGYKGYYLQKNNKYIRPYEKLDLEKTKNNLKKHNLDFENKDFISIDDSYVVLQNSKNDNNFIKKNISTLTLKKYLPNILINKFLEFINYNSVNDDNIKHIINIVENVLYSDSLFRTKAKKLFYYNDDELNLMFNRYFNLAIISDELKKEVVLNYPKQYIYEHLPLDYKEVEMIYVFYFIAVIELFSLLK